MKMYVILTTVLILSSIAYAGQTTLGIDGDYFTINDEITFILGISAMDGIGQLDAEQMDWLHDRGFRLIRVWAHWAQNILEGHAPTVNKLKRENVLWDGYGAIKPEKLEELRQLLKLADERGMIVDITVFHTMWCFPDDSDLDKRSRAIRELTEGIKDYRNVIYDIVNEHNFQVSHPDVKVWRDVVKDVDPDRICTTSSVHAAFGDVPLSQIMHGLKTEITLVHLDVLTPHLARSKDYAELTGDRVREIKAAFHEDGIHVPIYLQEEARRRHSGLNPGVDDFLLAATNAKKAGAAAWTFHTDAGYNFDRGTIYECMDDVEREVADKLAPALKPIPFPPEDNR